MGSKAPKAPPAPDPYATAAAQTGSNVSTAIANSWLGNANVNSPFGSVTNTQQQKKVSVRDAKGNKVIDPKTGKIKTTMQDVYKTVTDPSTGKTYKIPVFQQNIKLDPAQQKLLDQQNQLGASMNDLAMGQVGRLSQHLSANPNLTQGLPDVRQGPGNISLDGLPELGDMEEYRGKVESALMERMNPQLQRDYDDLENRLINQGLTRGSEAFTRAIDEHGRKSNDARTQIFLASGNESRAQMSEQRANRGQLFNERVTTNNDWRANMESDMARRNQMLQERLTERNQPINEITALMQGGQVTSPQFQPYNAGQVETTPIGQYTYQSNNIQQQQAANQANAAGQMWGNIGKIGAGLFSWCDRRLKTDIRYVHTDDSGINWYTFRYNGTNTPKYGPMADEVAEIRPDAVYRDSVTGYLYVNIGAL